MSIWGLYLKKFGRFEEVEMYFDEKVNVITGRNNAGKTTILDAICGKTIDKIRHVPKAFGTFDCFRLGVQFNEFWFVTSFQRAKLLPDTQSDIDKILNEIRNKISADFEKNGHLTIGYTQDNNLKDKPNYEKIDILLRKGASLKFSQTLANYSNFINYINNNRILSSDDIVYINKICLIDGERKELQELEDECLSYFSVLFPDIVPQMKKLLLEILPEESSNVKHISFTYDRYVPRLPKEIYGDGTQSAFMILFKIWKLGKDFKKESVKFPMGPVIVIEEIENSLHPALQKAFSKVICELANEFNIQIFVTTSSPFVVSEMKKSGAQIHLLDWQKNTYNSKEIIEPLKIIEELGGDASDLMLYEIIIFTEDAGGIYYMPELLRKLGISATNIGVLPMGGIANFKFYIDQMERLKNNFGKKILFFVDKNDNDNGSDTSGIISDFKRKCADRGVPCVVINKKGFENLFDISTIKTVMKMPQEADFTLGYWDSIDDKRKEYNRNNNASYSFPKAIGPKKLVELTPTEDLEKIEEFKLLKSEVEKLIN